MLGLKWLAGANITTFACGRISFASRLAVPMTRGLSPGLPLFEAVRVKCFQSIHRSSGGTPCLFEVLLQCKQRIDPSDPSEPGNLDFHFWKFASDLDVTLNGAFAAIGDNELFVGPRCCHTNAR